ncbi:hypothetical protein EKO27_g6566 [Xylaria grammica]|uniref:Uncharacterized protein n=1 Tax=Xylaria grammica TaxID=363999 RepID=A0A439D281_9PEZI|nr:hypothetical protein EKO27_g6566 [Xylaria grammica]
MSQLPEGTLGDAVGVLIFTFICFFSNILLLWLYWRNNEQLGSYFALLCTISSIIQQIYNYTLWNDLLWAQLYYIKANYKNADVIFNNGNFGFMRILAVIRLLCYIVESSYLLAYCIQVITKMNNFWVTRRDGERIFAVVGRIAPVFLAVITIGLLQTAAVQSSFIAYMVVANTQSVLSCTISIVLISIIIRQYVQAKLAWKRVQTTEDCSIWSRLIRSGSSNSSSSNSDNPKEQSTIIPVYTAQGTVFDDNWVVIRLSIAVVLISAFIVANVVTHLPQRDDVARDAQADEPDLGPERARSNIIGYIFGVTPGLAIWIVFGLTRDFRQTMYDMFVPRRWRNRKPTSAPPLEASWESVRSRQQADLSGVTVESDLQLDDMDAGAKRRPFPDLMGAPLLVSNSTPRLTPTDRSLSRDGEMSVV